MKNSIKNKKQHVQPPRRAAPADRSSPIRWILLGLGLILAMVSTWATLEYVVWNKVLWGDLPAELVGRWEVKEGPRTMKDAEIEFYRSGKMVGYFDQNDKLRVMDAQVRVEDNKLYITTRHPETGKEHVSVQSIRKLTAREFILADERSVVTKMVRMRD